MYSLSTPTKTKHQTLDVVNKAHVTQSVLMTSPRFPEASIIQMCHFMNNDVQEEHALGDNSTSVTHIETLIIFIHFITIEKRLF